MARGGVPEVVEDGKNGLLVKNLDPDAFAAAIARLLRIRKKRADWAKPRAKPSPRDFPRITWWRRRFGSTSE